MFGRVTPEQKRKLVHALQRAGHTVAMVGDGVNDVLALKDADCGIAMASGAQAASQVAQLVLLDSDFAALPQVVAEGRRVINNIQRSASLFLVKNIFSLLLSLAALCLPLTYPFQPLQLSLLSAVTIGLPSFVLALEPNYELVRGKFMHNVLHDALPGGVTDFLLVFVAQGFAWAFGLSGEALGTISTLLVLETGLIVLFRVCHPFTPLRWTLLGRLHGAGAGRCGAVRPLAGTDPSFAGGNTDSGGAGGAGFAGAALHGPGGGCPVAKGAAAARGTQTGITKTRTGRFPCGFCVGELSRFRRDGWSPCGTSGKG